MKLERHSPSSLNLFAAAPALFILEKVIGIRQQVGAPAHRGIAVEDGVSFGLLNPDASLESCVEVAFSKFDTISALSTDARRADFRAAIPAMVGRALAELRPYGIPTRTQGFVEWRPEGLAAPIVGYFDYEWADHGIIIDLKTTEKLPSQNKVPHARQVALYASTDNMDGRLCYVTPKKIATYQVENIGQHRNALHQIALRVERLLSLSDDPEFFKSIIVPDLESFYWNGPNRQLAYDHWKI